MLRRSDDETLDLQCPVCGARVETTVKEAEKGTVKCPNGHRFAVVGMLGGDAEGGEGAPR